MAGPERSEVKLSESITGDMDVQSSVLVATNMYRSSLYFYKIGCTLETFIFSTSEVKTNGASISLAKLHACVGVVSTCVKNGLMPV